MPLGQCKSFVGKDGKEAGGRCFGIGEDGKPGSGIWACTKFKPNSQAACAGSGMLRSVPAKLVVQI